jgi:hypothetical protein
VILNIGSIPNPTINHKQCNGGNVVELANAGRKVVNIVIKSLDLTILSETQ